jgi:LPS sulfotransferase NodH
MTRTDRVAQAVSFSRAIQSGAWSVGSGSASKPGSPVRFNFEQIDALVKEISAHTRAWASFLERSGIAAHQVTYEELLRDPRGVVLGVLSYLGIEDCDVSTTPSTKRQRDELNAEWCARYRSLSRTR